MNRSKKHIKHDIVVADFRYLGRMRWNRNKKPTFIHNDTWTWLYNFTNT